MNSAFGKESQEGYELHGRALASLVGHLSFPSAAFFTWFGREPSEVESVIFDACLVASLDHGVNPPSAQATRLVAGSGKPLADAVAAGMLAFGTKHGNAGAASAIWLHEHHAMDAAEAVANALASGERIPGFGHPLYGFDPRAAAIFAVLRAHSPSTPHADFAEAVARQLAKAKGKPVPLNVDGAIGAVCADMDWPTETADALFLLGRTAGLIAHAREAAAQAGESYPRGK
ncbi:MAG: citrate/2-methylcitrate synthase [Patescibacteria group bacterium]